MNRRFVKRNPGRRRWYRTPTVGAAALLARFNHFADPRIVEQEIEDAPVGGEVLELRERLVGRSHADDLVVPPVPVLQLTRDVGEVGSVLVNGEEDGLGHGSTLRYDTHGCHVDGCHVHHCTIVSNMGSTY